MDIGLDFLLAEAAIRQLHAHYVDACWRRDYVALADCFTADCEWRIRNHVIEGREACVEFFRHTMETTSEFLMLTLRNPVLHLDGPGKASGRTYFTAQNRRKDGSAFTPIGIYYERFVDEGDRWRFSWRLFQTLYAGPPDLSGELADWPDYGAPPTMPPMDALPTK